MHLAAIHSLTCKRIESAITCCSLHVASEFVTAGPSKFKSLLVQELIRSYAEEGMEVAGNKFYIQNMLEQDNFSFQSEPDLPRFNAVP